MKLTNIVLLAIIGIFISGCGLLSPSSSAEEATTPEAAPEVATTEAATAAVTPDTTPDTTPEVAATTPQATPEAAETPEAAATQEASTTEDPSGFISADGAYFVTADRLTVATGVNVNPAPEGHRWIMLTGTLANQSGPTVSVDTEDLTLLDAQGNRYEPGEMVERVQPSLIGSTLEAEDSVYGFAIFAVPEDVEPNTVEWCPGGQCDEPLRTPVTLFTNE